MPAAAALLAAVAIHTSPPPAGLLPPPAAVLPTTACHNSRHPQQSTTVLQMAAASGDMRRALEACTAALELKVQEALAEQADLTANALVTGGVSCLLLRLAPVLVNELHLPTA